MATNATLPWLTPRPPKTTKRKIRIVNGLMGEDFPERKLQGPLEPTIPKFNSIPYSVSTPETLKARLDGKIPAKPRLRRGWRSYKKPTAKEATTSAIIGGICTFVSFKGVMASYEHVSAHPLAHDVPFGLTEDINHGITNMIMGFGMLGVSLFAASSIGLGLLAAQLSRSKRETLTLQDNVKKVITSLCCLLLFGSTAEAAQRAPEVFERSCMGCHARGGNILQPGATLKLEDLKRNGITTVEDIFNITYYGKNRMPGFGEKCTPKGQCTFGPRLSDEEIQALAEFVKSKADENWPVIN